MSWRIHLNDFNLRRRPGKWRGNKRCGRDWRGDQNAFHGIVSDRHSRAFGIPRDHGGGGGFLLTYFHLQDGRKRGWNNNIVIATAGRFCSYKYVKYSLKPLAFALRPWIKYDRRPKCRNARCRELITFVFRRDIRILPRNIIYIYTSTLKS